MRLNGKKEKSRRNWQCHQIRVWELKKEERSTLQGLTRCSLDWGVCSAHWPLAIHVFGIMILWKPHGWSLVSISWRVNARRGNRFWKFAWAGGGGRRCFCLRSVRLRSCTVCFNAVFVHQGKLKYSRGGGGEDCKAKEVTLHTSFSDDSSHT